MHRFYYIIICLALVFQVNAQTKSKSKSIIVKGNVSDLDNSGIAQVKIDVIKNNKIVNSILSDGYGNYDLTLDMESTYILKFNKTGMVSKKISVSTLEINQDELKYGIFNLILNLSLFEYFPGLDIRALDEPMALIHYNEKEGDYDYDEEYSNKKQVQVEEIIANLQQLKRQTYDNFIKKADNYYSTVLLEDAWLDYLNALNVFPNEVYPKKQIDHIRDLLQKQVSKEKAYSTNINKADRNYSKQNYKISKSYYQKSLLYKSEEIYPKNRISEIEKLLSGNSELLAKIEKDVTKPENPVSQNNTSTNNELANSTQENKNENKNLIKNTGISQVNKKSIKTDTTISETRQMEFLNQQLKNYSKQGDYENVAKTYVTMGLNANKKMDSDKALDYFKEAYDVYGKIDKDAEQALLAETIADLNNSLYRYSVSSDWYARANSLFLNSGNQQKAFSTLMKAADASYSTGDMDMAISRYLQVLDQNKENAEIDQSSVYNSIGVIHFEMGNLNEAIEYFEKSIQDAELKSNSKEFSMSLNNLGNVKYERKDYPGALQYYNQSIVVKNKIKYNEGIAVSLHNIANVYKKTGDVKRALEYYTKSEKYAIESGNTDVIYENYGAMADIYAGTQDCGKAIHFYKLYSENKHLITRKSGFDQINESTPYYINMLERTNELDKLKEELKRHKLLSYYQASQKQKQIEYLHLMNQLGKQELINKENKVKWQYLIIGIALLGIILLIIFFIVLYRQYTSKKKANVLLAEQNEEINAQKQEIESQRDMLYSQKERIEHIHSELTSSIRYAQRIQQAMLPSLQLLADNNLQYNLMFKPRDIVSGDFYWVGKQNNYLIITVADCTGHGVPGAFMSMLGISFLNEIIRNKSILHASEILNQLRENLIQALKQNEITKADLIHADWLKDGMDISLCILNLHTNQLEYAGANNPLYVLKRNKILNSENQSNTTNYDLVEIKGDKMPIGIHTRMTPFNSHILQLESGDYVYLMSDGYADQFGGEQGKKFKHRAIKDLLKNSSNLSLFEQGKLIEENYNNWINHNSHRYDQVDDITVLGIKI